MVKLFIPFLWIAFLAGCSLAPDYERPESPVPNTYPEIGINHMDASWTGPAANLGWREFFGQDSRLRGLIALVLENNRDLRVAGLNVDRIQAILQLQRTALVPRLDATADGRRQRTPADLSVTGQPSTSSYYSAGLEIPSYELDFFGKVTRLRDQALQQYLATEEARLSLQISLIASVARQYYTVLAHRELLELVRQSLEVANRSYELNRQTFEAGIGSELDLRTAQGQLETYRAAVALLQEQTARAENLLVFLVGAPLPGDLPPAGSLLDQNLIEELPAGLPSELLTRRPDIRAAEHDLQAANAAIGYARAAFFPSVRLTAFGGTASNELSGLFGSGSGTWSFAPSITLPIFSSGLNKANLEVARVDERIAVARYEKTIQTAFREVADALAGRATINRRIAAQEVRVDAAQKRYELSDQRFTSGIDSFLSVLLAQQELFSAQQSLVDSRLARLTNLTALYTALGGGWPVPVGE